MSLLCLENRKDAFVKHHNQNEMLSWITDDPVSNKVHVKLRLHYQSFLGQSPSKKTWSKYSWTCSTVYTIKVIWGICTRNHGKCIKRKRKRSDSVLWQKPLHQQKCQKGKVTTQTTPQKGSIKQRLRTDLGRSVGVTKATQLVWLTGLRAHLPTNRNSRLIKRTHV